MIIKEQILEEVYSNIDIEDELDIIVDPEETNKLLTLLFESYKNPRASIIREYTSNSWDAQYEANNLTSPVIVTIDSDEGGTFISFTDEGIGMSNDFVNKVFRKILKSTKEKTNSLIGGKGIGSKSAFSYTNSFYVETTQNNLLNIYCIYRETSLSTKITHMLQDEVTDRVNGTIVKIYLKENYNEEETFAKTCSTELCYFDNVIFNFKNNNSLAVNYNYGKIIEGKTFKYRSTSQYNHEMHIILGKVGYNIDWKELELNSYEHNIAVGVKFEIGELQVNMTRESILYTDEAKILIKERIKAVLEELTARYLEQNKPIDNVFTYYIEKKNALDYKKLTFTTDIGVKVDLLLNSLKNKLPATRLSIMHRLKIDIKDLDIAPFIQIIGTVSNGVFKKRTNETFTSLNTNLPIIIIDKKEFKSLDFNKYIRNCIVIKVYSISKNLYGVIAFGQFCIQIGLKLPERNIIKPNDAPYNYKSIWRNTSGAKIGIAKVWYAYKKAIMQQLFTRWTRVIEFEDFEIPKEWKDEQKRIAKENRVIIERAQGTISVKSITQDSRIDLDLATLNDFTGIIFYGFQQDKIRLKQSFELMKTIKTIRYRKNKIRENIEKCLRIYQIAIANESPFIKNFKNAIHINVFLMSNNRLMNKIYTCYMIKTKYENLLKNTLTISKVNRVLGSNLNKLLNYYRKNMTNSIHDTIDNNELLQEIVSNAKLLNLGDADVIYLFNEIDKYLENVEILKIVDWTNDNLPMIATALKLAKKKVNYELYDSKTEHVTLREVIKTPFIGGLIERPYEDLWPVDRTKPRPVILDNYLINNN